MTKRPAKPTKQQTSQHDVPKGHWTHDAGGDATTRPNYISGYRPPGRDLKTREGGKRGK